MLCRGSFFFDFQLDFDLFGQALEGDVVGVEGVLRHEPVDEPRLEAVLDDVGHQRLERANLRSNLSSQFL